MKKLFKTKGFKSVIVFMALIIICGGVYFAKSFNKMIALYKIYRLKNNILSQYDGINTISDNIYKETGSHKDKRFLAIGFDDFRDSDFSLVYPLFKEYGYTATYNRIAYNTDLSELDIAKIDLLLSEGNELGDHTWFHCNYIYNDPLFNGQDPENIEGNQNAFPSNEDLRNDRGDGKNAFGFLLSEDIEYLKEVETTWGELTDEQCQIIRDTFSIYKDQSGMLDKLDELSNRYLGTSGSSAGSWDDERGCYGGGIYTGAKTSANHEIWERICQVTKLFYQEKYHEDFSFITWSWPGAIHSPFYYEKDEIKYYDSNHTKPYNYLAQFPSSIITDDNGNPVNRSWIQVLRQAGYKMTHDTEYPGRNDGQPLPMMSKQLIYNASFSRRDALLYSTNRTISYDEIVTAYPESYFCDTNKSAATQMYDGNGEYYKFIEAIRHDTSNGLVHGEVIDSVDSYSEKIFLTQVLEYCKQTGVEVIPKAEAYDFCFNYKMEDGNLIYNPDLRNTAKEFMPDAENIPDNPDGYRGDCYVIQDSDKDSALVTTGESYYLHYGVPLGDIRYSADVKGDGRIAIFAIKNSDSTELNNENLLKLDEISISKGSYGKCVSEFTVTNNEETDYEQLCEGLGEKIMGLKIVYSSGLQIKNITLEKVK